MLDRDKMRLYRLQGKITAREGRRISQPALMSWLLDLGEAENGRRLPRPSRPMSPRAIESLKRLSVRTGIRTRESEIDPAVSLATR